MTEHPALAEPPSGWPRCESEQLPVMLCGTYHMANPGEDEVNVESDDVLAPERQSELRDLVERFESWDPDYVAVEQPHDRQESVDSAYGEYRTEGLDDRNEVVQIGFRLADRLDHDRVHAVDADMSIAVDGKAPWTEGADSPDKLDFPRPDPEEIAQREQELLSTSTIPEILREMNGEPALRKNHDLMFADAIPWGAGEEFEGARLLGGWYERNLRIVQNVWRITESTDERVFLLVGSGHVRALRHLFDEAPMFCPVSPLPSLRS